MVFGGTVASSSSGARCRRRRLRESPAVSASARPAALRRRAAFRRAAGFWAARPLALGRAARGRGRRRPGFACGPPSLSARVDACGSGACAAASIRPREFPPGSRPHRNRHAAPRSATNVRGRHRAASSARRHPAPIRISTIAAQPNALRQRRRRSAGDSLSGTRMTGACSFQGSHAARRFGSGGTPARRARGAAGGLGPGDRIAAVGGARAAAAGAARAGGARSRCAAELDRRDEAVGLAEELLHLAQPQAARRARAKVRLDLGHLVSSRAHRRAARAACLRQDATFFPRSLSFARSCAR